MAADRAEAYIVAHQFGKLKAEIEAEQAPERLHLASRALPVFGGKSVESKSADPHSNAGFDDCSNGRDTRLMPRNSRQAAPPRPAAVTVHDDGDVTGNSGGIDFSRQRIFFGSRRKRVQQCFHGIQNPW